MYFQTPLIGLEYAPAYFLLINFGWMTDKLGEADSTAPASVPDLLSSRDIQGVWAPSVSHDDQLGDHEGSRDHGDTFQRWLANAKARRSSTFNVQCCFKIESCSQDFCPRLPQGISFQPTYMYTYVYAVSKRGLSSS